jgi:hypothetical protein
MSSVQYAAHEIEVFGLCGAQNQTQLDEFYAVADSIYRARVDACSAVVARHAEQLLAERAARLQRRLEKNEEKRAEQRDARRASAEKKYAASVAKAQAKLEKTQNLINRQPKELSRTYAFAQAEKTAKKEYMQERRRLAAQRKEAALNDKEMSPARVLHLVKGKCFADAKALQRRTKCDVETLAQMFPHSIGKNRPLISSALDEIWARVQHTGVSFDRIKLAHSQIVGSRKYLNQIIAPNSVYYDLDGQLVGYCSDSSREAARMRLQFSDGVDLKKRRA